MENTYCFNMYAEDYRNTSKSKPEKDFICNRNYRNSSSYSLSQDHSECENKIENAQNAFSQSNKPDILQNQQKEYLLQSYSKSGNRGIQHFDGDNPMHLRQDNHPKDKRKVQNTPVEDRNIKFRPNRKCLRSRSAPSILSLTSKQNVSGKGTGGIEWPKNDMRNERGFIVDPAPNIDKSLKKFRPLSKKRSQDMRSNQRNKYINVKKRHESRRRLKIPTKKLHFTENGKMYLNEKGLLHSVNEMKYLPDSRVSDETDRCSSYSESNLKRIAKRKSQRNERTTPDPNSQQILMQNIPKSSLSEKMKYISNALHFSNYEALYKESQNGNNSKKSDSRFTTDSFLRQELSDFKEFLIYRRNQKQRINLQQKQRLPTVNIPESFNLQKMAVCENRIVQKDYKNKKEYATGNQPQSPPNLKTRQTHKIRKPKVSDDVLWNHFKRNFKSHASTRRYSGEVIPRKISTAWMSEMGVVGDILTEADADNEFKKAAGSKVTMNLEEYKAFLITLTMKKKLPFYEIYRRMCGI